MIMEVKKHKTNHEVNLYYSKKSKAHYHNIINKDVNHIAQVFIDLRLEGFDIDEAYKIYRKKFFKDKDWLGFD